MYSLFYVLTNQHGDEFAPVRCNAQTISRLVGYFEDVVTENKLSALVVEGRCLDGDRVREAERSAKLAAAARHFYLFSCDRNCRVRTWDPEMAPNLTLLEEGGYHYLETGPFVLVMDARFCGLLASYTVGREEAHAKASYEMIWTFDPNVVFTAIEYLMARVSVRNPAERSRFEGLLNSCTPHTSSIRMALTFTTKLAMLMQRQNELEAAINTISSAISSTLELDTLLQAAVEEVGRALNARRAALVLWAEGTSKPESMNVYERNDQLASAALEGATRAEAPLDGAQSEHGVRARTDVEPTFDAPTYANGPIGTSAAEAARTNVASLPSTRDEPPVENAPAANYTGPALATTPKGTPIDGVDLSPSSYPAGWEPWEKRNKLSGSGPRPLTIHDLAEDLSVVPGPLEVPVTYRKSVIGVLAVEDDTPGRNWENEEMLMVKTVSDQLAVAISHARLFRQVQTQAMTDSLTGLYNLRYFKERLDREVRLADRNNEKVSLILLDLDHLKRINDTLGHRAGDESLRHVASMMQSTVRETDICARYGGEEFVIVLPQCGREHAIKVAEKLREAIAGAPVQKVGQVTASIGVATYPATAGSSEELIEMADRAMYLAKAAGRNRVRTLMHRSYSDIAI